MAQRLSHENGSSYKLVWTKGGISLASDPGYHVKAAWELPKGVRVDGDQTFSNGLNQRQSMVNENLEPFDDTTRTHNQEREKEKGR